MNKNSTIQNIRENKRKIKSDIKSLILNCLKNQSQSIYYKLEKANQTIVEKHTIEKPDSFQSVAIINGVMFWRKKSKFQDQYIKLKKIGEGSHSVVYLCKQKTTGNRYAAKMIPNVEEEKTQFLKSKFQILSSFDNDSIIKAKEIFINQNERTCYVILQYCPYPTLRQFMVQNKGKIQEQTVLKIVRSILCALETLNQKNVFHRDLKPQNILYDPHSGLTKLIDFETSKRFIQDNYLLTQTGTLIYRAPQTFIGFYGKRIDIWSIGIICYQMIFEICPFFSQNQKDIIRQIKQSPLKMKKNNCSVDMQNFLSQLLQKQEDDRISVQDAIQWIDDELQSNLELKSKRHSYSTNNSIMIDDVESPQIRQNRTIRNRKGSESMLISLKDNRFIEANMRDFLN